jgi:phosphoribosylformylglycinamidine (FGAM) synthase-like amidotransferase family enzyme
MISHRFIAVSGRPRVAILREQGVNSHYEMAAAFDRLALLRSTCI